MTAVIAAAILVFFVVSPLMDRAYSDPSSMQEDDMLLCVLRSYMEVTRSCREVIGLDVRSEGFARYDLAVQVVDGTQRLISGKNNVFFRMARGQYEDMNDPDGMMVQALNRFGNSALQPDDNFLKN